MEWFCIFALFTPLPHTNAIATMISICNESARAHGACRMCVCVFRFHTADAHTHDANAGALTLCARARARSIRARRKRVPCARSMSTPIIWMARASARRRRPMRAGRRPVALCVVVDSQKLRPRETRFGAPAAHTRRRACLLASCSACLYISVRFRFHWHNASARAFDIWMEFAYNEFNHFA